jgi:predicted glycosyltransferase involved in capsule biosynthesis
VEILKDGWDTMYPNLMKELGYHHFCMRQPGVHGASDQEGKITYVKDIPIQTIDQKPHGAVLAFDSEAFKTVGYFDEKFGPYGIEHVDWSNRVSLSGIQPPGFHDAIGSDIFFKIYGGHSSIPSSERATALHKARDKFAKFSKDKKRIHISTSAKTKVPEVTFVVPFQGTVRSLSIITVIQNVRAQKYPRVEIIAVEQDEKEQVRFNKKCLRYFLAKPPRRQAFTKSIAFNLGVSKASCKNIVLHDADMLVQADYTQRVMKILQEYDSCHIGSRVMYMNAKSTNQINREHQVTPLLVDRSVGYFEGGSLACKKEKFSYIGGFNEEFVGYGVEDCEFFERLKALTNMYDKRNIDLLHLAHGRSDGWETHHRRNKNLYNNMTKKSIEQRRSDLALRFKKKYQ